MWAHEPVDEWVEDDGRLGEQGRNSRDGRRDCKVAEGLHQSQNGIRSPGYNESPHHTSHHLFKKYIIQKKLGSLWTYSIDYFLKTD